jgi:hypothetical protein
MLLPILYSFFKSFNPKEADKLSPYYKGLNYKIILA